MGIIIPMERIRKRMEKKEYIEREYVIKCMEDSYKNAGISAEAKAKMTRWLKKAPAADVRPVVLCRDCKHRDPEDHRCDCGGMERQGCPFPVDDDYFCSYAEKREES